MAILLPAKVQVRARFRGQKKSVHILWLLVAHLIILTLSGCTPGSTMTGSPTSSPRVGVESPPVSTTAPTSTVSLVITSSPNTVIVSPAQAGQTIVVRVNQYVVVLPMSTEITWQVDYDSSILTALTPIDKMNMPGPNGWLFQAVAAGQTDLVMTSVPAPCPPGTPCAPMPARVTITIEVQP